MGETDWSRFFDRYYFINALVILSYALIRYRSGVVPELANADAWSGLAREHEIIMLLSLSLLSKWRLSPSVDAFVDQAFLFGKLGVVVLLWHIDRRIMSWYLILYLVLFLSCRPPAYTGRNNLIELTETSFRRRVRDATAVVDGGDGGDKKAVSWLVFLYADWQKNSHWHLPMFAKLSLQFASPKLRFGKLDLSRHPGVAADCNIDVGARSKQLPSMILFTGGRERARLPDFRSDGSVINTIIDERGSIAFFHLEQEFGLQNSGHKKQGKAKDKKSKKTKTT